MKGIREWKTADGIAVLEIHYSADPSKDPDTPEGADWLKRELVGYPGGMLGSKWRKEMEIDWSARGGELIFPIMRLAENKIRVNPFIPPAHWTIIGGFDWGNRNPSAYVFTAINPDGHIYVVDEIYGSYLGHKRLSSIIQEHPLFKRVAYSYADPSLWNEDQSDKESGNVRSRHSLFIDQGLVFIKGDKGDLASIELVNGHYWPVDEENNLREGPYLFICKNCTETWREWSNLRYADFRGNSAEEHNKKEKLVDKNNHTWDAVKSVIRARPTLPKAPSKPVDPVIARMQKHIDMKAASGGTFRDPNLGIVRLPKGFH